MKLSIHAGATSQSVNVFIRDSSSTTGAGLTGLAYNTAGLTAYYSHAGANATATSITLATLAAVNSSYSSGGFKELDSTNMPGWYRFDIPNACLATSKGRSVAIHLKGATNMAPLPIEIELTGWDNQSTTDGGLSKLTSLTFTVSNKIDANVYTWNGTAVTAPNTAGTPVVDVGRINNVPTSSVTTINANQGTTQPINFTGTGASATAKSDLVNIAGSAVSTTSAQIGVNVVNAAGTAWASGAITSSVLATDCLTSTQLAASAVTEIWASVTDSSGVTTLLSRLTSTRAGYLDNLSSAPPSASTIAAEVWDLTTTGHTTGGTFGAAMNAAGSAGDPWATALPGAYSAGSAGYILGTNLDALISSRSTVSGVWSNGTRSLTALGFTYSASDFGTDWLTSTGLAASAVTEIWAAVADSAGVTTLLSRLTNTRASNLDNLDAAISTRSTYAGGDTSGTTTLLSRLSSARAGYLDNLSAGAVATAAAVSALNNISASDVLAQVNAALDTALTLPGQAAPTETPTIRTGLAQLYQQSIRPYTQDSSSQKLYNAAGSTVLQKRTVSDDGTTLTYGALVSGP